MDGEREFPQPDSGREFPFFVLVWAGYWNVVLQVEAQSLPYIALEDTHRRLQDRLISQPARRGTHMAFATHWSYLERSGLAV